VSSVGRLGAAAEGRLLSGAFLGAAGVGAAAGLAIAADAPAAATGIVLVGSAWLLWLASRGALAQVRLALLVPSLVLSACALASHLVARDPSPFTFSLALAPAAAALVASLVRAGGRCWYGTVAMAAVAGALGIVSLARWVTDAPSDVGVIIGGEVFWRVYHPAFGHPNGYAAALTLTLPFALAGALRGPSSRRVGCAVCLALGVLGLGLTYSRAFWVAFAVSCLIVAGSRRARLALAGVGAVALAALGGPVIGRLASEDPFDNIRLDLWGEALRIIAEHPLLGVGLENFGFHADGLVHPDFLDPAPHAHNVLLIAATDVGLIGAGALVAAMAALTVALVRTLRDAAGDRRSLALAALGALAAAGIGGGLDGVVFHNVYALVIGAAAAGLAAAATYAPGRARGA
jgi:hypothetical protein